MAEAAKNQPPTMLDHLMKLMAAGNFAALRSVNPLVGPRLSIPDLRRPDDRPALERIQGGVADALRAIAPSTVREPHPGAYLGNVEALDDADAAMFRDHTGELIPADSAKHLLQYDPDAKAYKVYERQGESRPGTAWDSTPGRMGQSAAAYFSVPGDAYAGRVPFGEMTRRGMQGVLGLSTPDTGPIIRPK